MVYFMRKNKSSTTLKIIGFLAFLTVFIGIVIFISSGNANKLLDFKNSKQENVENGIGQETYKNIENGKIKIACNDAKKLGSLFITINDEMIDDNITDMEKYATSSSAKRQVDDFINNFIAFIEKFYTNDLSHAEAVIQAINMDIYSNIVQTSIMVNTGNISEEEFYKYLNIEYCGMTPPATYISPKDIVLYSINNSNGTGRKSIESLIDNNTTK